MNCIVSHAGDDTYRFVLAQVLDRCSGICRDYQIVMVQLQAELCRDLSDSRIPISREPTPQFGMNDPYGNVCLARERPHNI